MVAGAMKQLNLIDWVLLFLTAFILLLAASGAAVASEPQITLAPGTWQVVEFSNSENERENLTIINISAPDVLLPYVVVSPTSIPPLSSENVTVQFAYVDASVRKSVPQDVFAVQVDGLLVYLDLSVPLPENAENRWAELEARIEALRVSFAEQMEGLASRVTALESVEQENWMPELEALWENLIGLGDWTTSKVMELWEAIPENSPPSDTAEWDAELDNLEKNMLKELADANAQMRRNYEKQIADTKADTERTALIYSVIAAVAAFGGVGVYFKIRKFKGTSEKTSKRRSKEGGKGDDNPIKTQRKW